LKPSIAPPSSRSALRSPRREALLWNGRLVRNGIRGTPVDRRANAYSGKPALRNPARSNSASVISKNGEKAATKG